ncbi:hypothetical protein C0214_13610 [Methylobacterium sp. DM1]|nr:hypothetical protein C0214_13610 [Methylobacterium sp. DM1]
MSRADPHFRLRLPEDIKERVRNSAERNRRSMTGEIIMILASALGDESKPATGESLQANAPAAGPNSTALQGGPVTHR